MSDQAYSLLLFSGLLSGPASAFLISPVILPVFIIFPLACIPGAGGKTTLRLLGLTVAPVLAIAWGLWASEPDLTDRAVRWLAAVFAGASMAGALGTSRASALIHDTALKVDRGRTGDRSFGPGGFLDSLSMLLALAGPYSRSVKEDYLNARRTGTRIFAAFSRSLSRLPDLTDEAVPAHSSERMTVHISLACLAWILLLSGTAGIP